MLNTREIFLDKQLRYGGFYELAIQVCPSTDNRPIKLYTDYIWTLQNVAGPYDEDFRLIQTDIEEFQHRGIVRLGKYEIPFMTYNVREIEPIETDFNWFDICFSTASIESIFGSEYQTWIENPKVPKELLEFLMGSMKRLFRVYPFKLAMIDFEVSGEYYFADLKKPLNNNWESTAFYIGQSDYDQISIENRKLVTKIEDL